MAYRQGNYSFVIDSSFNPFSMQEMLAPLAMYKDAYEKSEEAYINLTDNADKFKYLSETLPEGSRARQIYEGYANDLKAQADDLVKNGLSMGNRRGLLNLKRRYQGEIGRLANAQEKLDEELKLRRQMGAKDPSMLYAEDMLNIDKYLDGQTPNLYSISGSDLYTRGAAAGQAASKRIYGSEDAGRTLGGYYRDYVQRMGYTPEQLRQFSSQISADFSNWAATNIPELGLAANQILEANGVTGNLTGDNLRRAQQQVIRGLIDGSVYSENHDLKRDEGVMSAYERSSLAMQQEARDFERQVSGWVKNAQDEWIYDPKKDRKTQAAVSAARAVAEAKNAGKSSKGSGGSGGGNARYTQIPKGVKIEWDDDPEAEDANYSATEVDSSPSSETTHEGKALPYDALPQYAKDKVDAILGPEGNVDLHMYYFKPFERGIFSDKEAVLEILPLKVSLFNGEESIDMENDSDLE